MISVQEPGVTHRTAPPAETNQHKHKHHDALYTRNNTLIFHSCLPAALLLKINHKNSIFHGTIISIVGLP